MNQEENNQLNTEENVVVISDHISDDARWYVIHTYSGHERKVAITLKQRVESIGMLDRIF